MFRFCNDQQGYLQKMNLEAQSTNLKKTKPGRAYNAGVIERQTVRGPSPLRALEARVFFDQVAFGYLAIQCP